MIIFFQNATIAFCEAQIIYEFPALILPPSFLIMQSARFLLFHDADTSNWPYDKHEWNVKHKMQVKQRKNAWAF